MNCKQGDLAIFVKGKKNSGRIVKCLKFIPEDGFCSNGFPASRDGWEVDIDIAQKDSVTGIKMPSARYAPDDCLRPIRDLDGEDETFTWAGKPQKENS